MASVYESFLRSPNVSLLTADASINYITTTTTVKQADAVIKHLQALERQIQKKDEKILSRIETSTGVCLETETTYFIQNGGGVLLPGMDDNMLADCTIICPMVSR